MTTIFKLLPNVLIVSATQVSDRSIVLIKIMALDSGFELYEEIVQDGIDISQSTLLEIPYADRPIPGLAANSTCQAPAQTKV